MELHVYIHKIRQIKHEGDYQEWQTSNLPIYYGVLKGEYKYKDSIVIYYKSKAVAIIRFYQGSKIIFKSRETSY